MLLTQVKRIKVFHRGIKSHTEEREGKVEDKKKALLSGFSFNPKCQWFTPKILTN